MATNDKKINCGTVRDIFRDKICSPNNNDHKLYRINEFFIGKYLAFCQSVMTLIIPDDLLLLPAFAKR